MHKITHSFSHVSTIHDLEKSMKFFLHPHLQHVCELPQNLWEHMHITLPKEESHGDFCLMGAQKFSKTHNLKKIQDILCSALAHIQDIDTIRVHGPFINICMKPEWWSEVCREASLQSAQEVWSHQGEGEKVLVEYVSANPTGLLHIGHARGAVLGDALALLYQHTGHEVTKEYYINDAGHQIDCFMASVWYHYQDLCGVEEDNRTFPSQGYPGKEIENVARRVYEVYGPLDAHKLGHDTNHTYEAWSHKTKKFCINTMMDFIRRDLAWLGIHHDIFVSEQDIYEEGYVQKALHILRSKGYVREDFLEDEENKTKKNTEIKKCTVFYSSRLGDEKDRCVQKSDGAWTYLAGDIGYHFQKAQRGYSLLVNVWGADHHGYISRIKAALSVLAPDVELYTILGQMVHIIGKDGTTLKMSKRLGSSIAINDLSSCVAGDVMRFWLLRKNGNTPMDIPLHTLQDMSKNNAYFYVQYAHARVCSLLAATKNLVHEHNTLSLHHKRLIRGLLQSDIMIKRALKAQSVHILTDYTEYLARLFHSMWQDREHKILYNGGSCSHDIYRLLLWFRDIIAYMLCVIGITPLKTLHWDDEEKNT